MGSSANRRKSSSLLTGKIANNRLFREAIGDPLDPTSLRYLIQRCSHCPAPCTHCAVLALFISGLVVCRFADSPLHGIDVAEDFMATCLTSAASGYESALSTWCALAWARHWLTCTRIAGTATSASLAGSRLGARTGFLHTTSWVRAIGASSRCRCRDVSVVVHRHQSVCLCVSVCLSVCLFVCLSVCLCVYLCVCLCLR